MKSAAIAFQCSDAGAREVVQHLYQLFFRVCKYKNFEEVLCF